MERAIVAAIQRSGARSVTIERGETKHTLTVLSGDDHHKLVETILGAEAVRAPAESDRK